MLLAAHDDVEIVDFTGHVASEYETPNLIKGLTSSPKAIPCSFFYDDTGSRLFEQLCQQSEYYLTRTERIIPEQYSGDIVTTTGPCDLVELGSGKPRSAGREY